MQLIVATNFDRTKMTADVKAIIAVLFTIFSMFYLGTYYIEDINLAPDLLVPKESFFHGVGQAVVAVKHGSNASSSAGNNGLEPPFSKYAYTTLLHGIDDRGRYRGFLHNTVILKTLLVRFGSKQDVIAMIGYTNGDRDSKFDDDINFLRSYGIKIYYLPRMVHTPKVNFGEMALLKITPWSFSQYEAVQYFDADVMPRKNLDMFFQLEKNSFHTGSASPVNSGWFLARPNAEHYKTLWQLAVKRLEEPWDSTIGWGQKVPADMPFRGGFKYVKDWNFNGASLDQGLFTHYFVLNNGEIQLFDSTEVRIYGPRYELLGRPKLNTALSCCGGKPPIIFFAHFTGRNKPWLKPPVERKGPDVKLWFSALDSLNLPINSSEASSPLLQTLNSPLGYFHANK